MRISGIVPETSTTLLRQIGADVHNARWAEFIARYTPMCRQYLRRHFPSLESDDILQEMFAAIAKALPNYRYVPDEKGHFRNYLVGILHNKALMALRKMKRGEETADAYAEEKKADAAAGMSDTDAEDDDWRKAVLEIALQQMMADESVHERTKQIFVRTAIRNELPNEVARALGVSRNVVDQQKRRALAKFKEIVVALRDVV